MRILFAEDEPDLGRAVKRTLMREGYVVDWASSGDEALGFLEQSADIYVVAVFDWMLPGTTGVELCQWLRQRSRKLLPKPITAPSPSAANWVQAAHSRFLCQFRHITD